MAFALVASAPAFASKTGPKPRTGYYVPSETGSPFIYESKHGQPTVDFARYCREFNGDQSVDLVMIQLGGNDVWRGTDESIDRLIDSVLGYFDALIEMVHEFDKQTKVGIVLLDPPLAVAARLSELQGAAQTNSMAVST